MRLLSVDPGVHKMATAEWKDGLLRYAFNSPSPPYFDNTTEIIGYWGLKGQIWLPAPDEVVGEFPFIYPKGHGSKKSDSVDPNDIVLLAACAAAFYSGFRSGLKLYLPSEWKAQVPKNICRQRIEAELSAEEKECIRKGGPMHDIYDAIGIGLFHLGRLGRGMVRP